MLALCTVGKFVTYAMNKYCRYVCLSAKMRQIYPVGKLAVGKILVGEFDSNCTVGKLACL